jgi:hypothetical protein
VSQGIIDRRGGRLQLRSSMETEQHATVFRIFLPFEIGQRSEGDYLPQCASGCSATSTLRSDRVECLGHRPFGIGISTEKR